MAQQGKSWPPAKTGYFGRDLAKQGLYVDPQTNVPKTNYHVTVGNWDPDVLPKPTKDLDQLRADMDKWGYCMVAEALSPAQLETVRRRFAEQASAERKADVGYYGQVSMDADAAPTNQMVYGLVNKGQCFRDVIEMSPRGVQGGPAIERLMTELLGPGFLLNTAASWIAGRNGTPQDLHNGQGMVPKPWPPWPFECNVAYMLDDCTAGNGGTLIVPGSHRILTAAGAGPAPRLPPTTSAAAPAGTALIFEGRTVHGTGVNRTDRPRRVLLMAYHKSFMRTQENFGVMLDRRVYESATPKLRELLGFAVTPQSGTLGGVEACFEGPGGTAFAPLRDGYVPISELGPGSSDAELRRDFTFRGTPTGRINSKRLARMRETGQMIVQGDPETVRAKL